MSEHSAGHIPLQKQSNFRDLGGYETADGRSVKPGLIYRSGELSKLTAEDLDKLQALGIKTVVDLRSAMELQMFGEDRLPAGTKLLALPIEPGNWGSALFDVVKTGDTSQIPDNVLVDTSRSIIRDGTEQLAALFEALSDPSNLPLVFHCSAGKDRTGIAAAVFLMALGVSADLAKGDYLKSNDYLNAANEEQLMVIRRMIAARLDIDPAAVDISKFNQLFYQEPAYFEAALDEIEQRYGSFETYLAEGLGLKETQIQELREQFTA
jgi:protein-tyrosine phosphatase